MVVKRFDKLIDAVAYYRMSDEDQKHSIEQQRAEVEAYARRNGYRIIREYIDYGKSGSKEQEKRVEFQRMLMESSSGDFQAVLCWDAHRFARLDSIDGAFAKKILRSNGIWLDTVKEGKFDWSTVEGRWKDMAFSEAGKAYSINLSRDSLRGRRNALERNSWPHGAIPYGYFRCYIDEQGNQHVMPRIAKFRKPKHWRLILVINEAEAKIVRHLFREFVTRDVSYRQLAKELNEQGIKGPDWMDGRMCDWTKDNVKRTLARAAYIGIAQIGYARKTRKEAFSRAEKAEKTGICPPILEGKDGRQFWKDAQAKIAKLTEEHSRHHSRRSSVLSGILVCGKCGHKMSKRMKLHRKPCTTRFTCAAAGRGRLTGCHQWSVQEADVLPIICKKLVEELDAEILNQLQARPGEKITDLAVLEKHVELLEAKVTTATRRYLTAPEDMKADAEIEWRKIKDELADAENALKVRQAMDTEGGVQAFASWWDKVRDGLVLIAANGTAGKAQRPVLIEAVGADGKWQPVGCFVYDDAGNEGAVFADERFTVVNEDGTPAPVVADQDTLRALLKKLGVTAKIFWKKTGKNKGRNSKAWAVDFARIKVEIAWTEENDMADPTNKRSPALPDRVWSIPRGRIGYGPGWRAGAASAVGGR